MAVKCIQEVHSCKIAHDFGGIKGGTNKFPFHQHNSFFLSHRIDSSKEQAIFMPQI